MIRIDVPQARGRPPRAFCNRASGRRFEVTAQVDDETVITLYDEIGFWGVDARSFRAELDRVTTDRIRLDINSPGGDVFDGIAMHNDLEAHPAEVTVRVTGLAASAASIVAMAGDRVVMPANGFLMIHNAWALAIGDEDAMTEMAATLRKVNDALASTYAERTGKSVTAMRRMMAAETWLNGESAVDEGFADALEDGQAEASARFDLSTFRNTPSELAELPAADPITLRDLERGLRDAGYSRSQAKTLAARVSAEPPLRDAGALDAETRAALDRLYGAMQA